LEVFLFFSYFFFRIYIPDEVQKKMCWDLDVKLSFEWHENSQ